MLSRGISDTPQVTPDCHNVRMGKANGSRVTGFRASIAEDHYQKVAESLVAEIEQGMAPLAAGLGAGGQDRSGRSQDRQDLPLRELRVHLLRGCGASKPGFGDERQGTYMQIKGMGRYAPKGERGGAILFWLFERMRPARHEWGRLVLDAAGKPVREIVRLRAPRVRRHTVLNAEQATWLLKRPARAPGGYEWDRLEEAGAVLR